MSAEIQRVNFGAAAGDRAPGLGVVRFVASCPGNAAAVLQTAKATLRVAIDLSEAGIFDEAAWEAELPREFAKRCGRKSTQAELDHEMEMTIDERVRRQQYELWSVEMFMNAFRPELGLRTWSWWDGALLDGSHVAVAVAIDDWPFPWQSLRWLFRGSGATDLVPEE